jgi:hypothetical protein
VATTISEVISTVHPGPERRQGVLGGDTPWHERSLPWRLGIIAIALCAFGIATGLVFHDLSTGHDLYGLTEFDDGVYFGAAMHLVNGQLPYRMFDFVQPPGITIILAPIALIVGPGDPRVGLAAARILTGIVMGFDAILVVWILRYRGLLAALLGGMLMAIYPPSVNSDHTLMLEPYLIFFCLLAIALAFHNGRLASDRRLMLAGVALGFAGTVKVFAAAIAVAFFLVLIFRHRDKLRPLVLGALLGFVIPCLPFFIGAPHNFVHEVFISQLSRNTAAPSPFETRLVTLVGLSNVASSQNLPIGPTSPWPWLAGSLLAFVTVVGTFVPTLRRRSSTFTWFIFFAALVSFAMVLIPRQFYTHYDILASVMFAIVVGGVFGTVVSGTQALVDKYTTKRTQDRETKRRVALHHSPVLLGVGWLCALAILAGSAGVVNAQVVYQRKSLLHFGDPGPELDRAIPAGSCVVTDATSLLVVSNRMNFSPTCPVLVDSTGTWLAYDPTHPPQRNHLEPKDPQLVALWKQALSHAQYAIFAGAGAFRVPFTPALSAWFNDNFVHVPGAAPITFVKRPHPIANAPSLPNVVP